MSANLFMAESKHAILKAETECPKCHGSNVIVASEKESRGVPNNERGEPVAAGKYRRIVFRCLRCNHRWADYYA